MWGYLKQLMTHKWFAFLECLRVGIPFLGLVHDASKFSPIELKTYARKFGKPREEQTEEDAELFRRGWLHHQHANKHHWVYWVVYAPIPSKDWDPSWGCIPMPERYRLEMLADWRAMARQHGNSVADWYYPKRDTILLHPETRAKIEHDI